MTAGGDVFHLALREFHAAAGATFIERVGWALPGQYAGVREEHRSIRTGAALVERSHRSRVIVSGTDAAEVLWKTLAGRISELEEGRAMRTALVSPAGVIEDLVLVSRMSGIAYLVTGEPGQRQTLVAALNAAIEGDFDARVDDRTETTCLVGLVGPAAAEVATKFLSESLPPRLPSLHTAAFEFHGFRATATRTSDTGEDGFDLMLAPAVALHLAETLAAEGVPWAGFEAQEVARVEACIPAFEPDLAGGLSPAQADLDVMLEIEGGAEGTILSAMLIEGEGKVAVGTAVSLEGSTAGEVRSCVDSYSLDAVAALAVLDQMKALPGERFTIAGRDATVAGKPLLRRRQDTQ